MRISPELLLAFVASFALASSHLECDSAEARPSLFGLDLRLAEVEAENTSQRLFDATGREIGVVAGFRDGPGSDGFLVILPELGARISLGEGGDLNDNSQVYFDEPGCAGTAYATQRFSYLKRPTDRAFVAEREALSRNVLAYSRLGWFDGCVEQPEGQLLPSAARLRELAPGEFDFEFPLPTPLFVGWPDSF